MIYLDHASTTYVYPEVIDKITDSLKNNWGNPSNLYDFGEKSHKIINQARESIARVIGAKPNEIFFTSGASEGNSWVIQQVNKVLCSGYEHHSVLTNPKCWIIDELYLDKINKLLDDEAPFADYENMLCSWMYVNNETGEIFDIKKIGEKAHLAGMLFHSDMTQALGHIPINVKELGVDFATFTGHKVHAPKGIGFVYVNSEKITHMKPLIWGGMQEKGYRAGTENVAYIEGLRLAVINACNRMYYIQDFCKRLKNKMKENLYNLFPNGEIKIISPGNSVDNILNIAFKDISGEVIADELNKRRIYISTGSACNSGNLDPSDVYVSMDIEEEYLNGELRFSFDGKNTFTEIEEVCKALKEIYDNLINDV